MILAEVVRSGFVESVHHGSVVVTPGVASAGDVTGPMFPRSSTKPLQTVGMLRAGLAVGDGAALALISGSHYGEPIHVRMVREVLEGAGLELGALRCPAALPTAELDRNAWLRSGGGPERVLMNCSGKHAGMLATCVANGWPTDTYLDPKHPLQVALAETVAGLTGEPVAMTAVDGCGAPLFGFSLTGLARSFSALVDAAPGTPERRVADEMRAHPELVAGTGADDTVLMRAVPGLLSKVGAEGVVAAAAPGTGAVALKISDGSSRARIPVLLSGLRRLGLDAPHLTEGPRRLGLDAPHLTELVLGGGEPVGEVRSTW